MNLILINPPFYVFQNLTMTLPALGLNYIAAFLEKNGVDVRVHNYDCSSNASRPKVPLPRIQLVKEEAFNRNPIWEKIKHHLSTCSLDIIGITATTPQFNSALKIARIVKSLNPDSIIIIGGAHATALPQDVFSYDCFDIVAAGESEFTMLDLVKTLKKGGDVNTVKGIFFKKNGRIVSTGKREAIEYLDSLPFPVREYIDGNGMRVADTSGSIVSSRGCIYDCNFCSRKVLWGKNVRFRSAENIVSEMMYLSGAYGINEFEFWDDSFTINKKRIQELCSLIKSKKLDITWACQTRADTLDDELLSEMKRAGCRRITLGIESGSAEVLKKMNKKLDLETAIKNSDLIKQKGILLRVNVILGYPDETEASLKQTEKFLARLDPHISVIFFFTPLPGSRAFEDLSGQGRIIEKNWLFYMFGNPDLIFTHKYLNRKILLKYYSRMHYQHLFRSLLDKKKLLKIVQVTLAKPGEVMRYLFRWVRLAPRLFPNARK